MYLDKNGNRVHPRTIQGLSEHKVQGQKFASRAFDITNAMGYKKYFGLQFRYVYPLCDKKEWKLLLKSSPYEWKQCDYPKDSSCIWKEQINKGKRIDCEKPNFITTNYVLQEKKPTLLEFF